MTRAILVTITLLTHCFGGNVNKNHDVLMISGESITSTGNIDLKKWRKWKFDFAEPISVGSGKDRREYYKIFDLYFEVSSNTRIKELEDRFKASRIDNDVSVVSGKMKYQNKALKYNKLIKNHEFGSRSTGDSITGFKFSKYIIFMVKVRDDSNEDPFDFVIYDLTNDTYSVKRTYGSFPRIWIFSRNEGLNSIQ